MDIFVAVLILCTLICFALYVVEKGDKDHFRRQYRGVCAERNNLQAKLDRCREMWQQSYHERRTTEEELGEAIRRAEAAEELAQERLSAIRRAVELISDDRHDRALELRAVLVRALPSEVPSS